LAEQLIYVMVDPLGRQDQEANAPAVTFSLLNGFRQEKIMGFYPGKT
jgi:hypothetical protein